MKATGIPWLGQIPAHWTTPKARYVSHIFVPGRDKPLLKDSGDFPWITLDDIRLNTHISKSIGTKWVEQHDLSVVGGRVLPSGSVIASCVGEFGLAAIALDACVINQQLQAYLVPTISSEFLRYCVQAGVAYFNSVATATTIRYINQDRFAAFPIPFPPRAEQDRIVKYLQDADLEVAMATEKIRNVINLLREYRSALITAAVTGQLDIREHERKLEALA